MWPGGPRLSSQARSTVADGVDALGWSHPDHGFQITEQDCTGRTGNTGLREIPYRQHWSGAGGTSRDGVSAPTDQEVGGSSPSGRAENGLVEAVSALSGWVRAWVADCISPNSFSGCSQCCPRMHRKETTTANVSGYRHRWEHPGLLTQSQTLLWVLTQRRTPARPRSHSFRSGGESPIPDLVFLAAARAGTLVDLADITPRFAIHSIAAA